MYRIVKQYSFEAAHRLPKVPDGHKCGRVHGHSYRVEVELQSGDLTAQGWVCDFGDVSKVAKPLLDSLDHQLLNDFNGLENPTCEVLAFWIYRKLETHLTALASITVHETATSRGRYGRN